MKSWKVWAINFEIRNMNIKRTFLSLAFLFATAVNAQSIAFVDFQGVVEGLPEYPTVQQKSQAYAQQLQADLQEMMTEFQAEATKLQEDEKSGTLTSLTLQSRVKELQEMENRIVEFERDMGQDYQRKQQELLQPLIDKVRAAVDAVSAEEGVTYVLEKSSILSINGGTDLTPKVRANLGL
jgi:outer membrane protein